MEKAVIYIRVSTELQTEKSQLSACERFCKEKNWTIVDTFKEHGKSAFHNVYRPKYEAVLKLVRQHRIQHVVVWALDRWTRRGNKELRNTISYLNSYGVQLHSVHEHWIEQITSPELSFVKDVVLDVLGWIGKQESERISERVKSSEKFQKALKKGTVGRPTIKDEVSSQVIKFLQAGKTYSYITEHVIYKAKYGKIRHVTAPTISTIKKSALEKGLLVEAH